LTFNQILILKNLSKKTLTGQLINVPDINMNLALRESYKENMKSNPPQNESPAAVVSRISLGWIPNVL
jgi:small nuclear ribonucleoprotein (snRNP)-like protein